MEHTTEDVAGVVTHPPIIYVVSIAVAAVLHELFPMPMRIRWGEGIGVLLALAGFALSVWSVVTLLVQQVNPDPSKPTSRLVVGGPYKYSRNPIYVAYTLLQLGIAIWSGWGWIAAMLVPATAVMIYGVILREESYLANRFPDEYETYRSRVRRWI